MPKTLLTPIHLDALIVDKGRTTLEGMADFSQLPYAYSEKNNEGEKAYRYYHTDKAFLSEEILTHPFEDKGQNLLPGVHLHWSMPDTLTRAMDLKIVKWHDFLDTFQEWEQPNDLNQARAKEVWNTLLESSWLTKVNPDLAFVKPLDDAIQSEVEGTLSKFKVDTKALFNFVNQLPKQNFPPLPNRWLIRRKSKWRFPAYWLIQSDCLKFFNEDDQVKEKLIWEDKNTFIGVPYLHLPTEEESRPFGYLGNRFPQNINKRSWTIRRILRKNKQEPGASYLNYVPAIGYGDPTFAAFYPNCQSVFGFYDPLARKNGKLPDEYLVMGWYEDKNLDFFSRFLPDFEEYFDNLDGSSKDKGQELKAALRWDYDSTDPLEATDHLFCYASLKIEPDKTDQAQENDNKGKPVSLAVGNTNAEALSALLASQMAKSTPSENPKGKQVPDQDTIKQQLEEQLISLEFAPKLSSRELDIGPKFQEFRHGLGFQGIRGGIQWTIIPRTLKEKSGDMGTPYKGVWTLPDDIAPLLDELNQEQHQYNQKLREIDALKRQIYADWSKYMVTVYPPDGFDEYGDPDKIKFYIEEKGLPALERLNQKREEADKKIMATVSTLTTKLKSENQKTETSVSYSYALIQKAAPRYWEPNEPVILLNGDSVVPTTRHGQDGRLHDKGYLQCHLLPDMSAKKSMRKRIRQALRAIDKLSRDPQEKIGHSIWKKQTWNPFLLEWEVELHTMKAGGNQFGANEVYESGFIDQNYSLAVDDIDLKQPKEGISTLKSNDIYRGRSILTPAANDKLQHELGRFVIQKISSAELQAFYTDQTVAKENQNSKWLQANVETVIQWFLKRNKISVTSLTDGAALSLSFLDDLKSLHETFFNEESGLPDKEALPGLADWIKKRSESIDDFFLDNGVEKGEEDAYLTANPVKLVNWYIRRAHLLNYMSIYEVLALTPLLSQALSGFNHALLQHRQSFQLPIADPIGFEEYQDFTQKVRQAVGRAVKLTPQPLNAFTPIRNGELNISKLRLVDTFGMTEELDIQELILSDLFKPANHDQSFWLPPRIVQPSRLNFRWLSAGSGQEEMSDNPTTSPVCGWLLSNKLDHELMVYSHAGKMLGYLVSVKGEVQWRQAPGGEGLSDHTKVPDETLQKLIRQIIQRANESFPQGEEKQKNPYLQELLHVIDSAMENIEPEGFAHDQVRTVLMGRPIAVVRVSVSLETMGPAALHQGFEAMDRDIGTGEEEPKAYTDREDDGFTQVQFPVRIGEHRQFDDGLVGYWREGSDPISQVFYSPESTASDPGHTELFKQFFHTDDPDADPPQTLNLPVSVDANHQILTLLFDPRGKLHATSGILPTKVIDIPPDQYHEALKRIEVTFRAMPVITPQDRITLPLPEEPGYAWSWLEEKADETWFEVSTTGILREKVFTDAMDQEKAVKEAKLSGQEIWEKLTDASWLIQLDTDRASVVPKDQRPKSFQESFGKIWADPKMTLANLIENYLDRSHIDPIITNAQFNGPLKIREGWLKLKHTPDSETPQTN